MYEGFAETAEEEGLPELAARVWTGGLDVKKGLAANPSERITPQGFAALGIG